MTVQCNYCKSLFNYNTLIYNCEKCGQEICYICSITDSYDDVYCKSCRVECKKCRKVMDPDDLDCIETEDNNSFLCKECDKQQNKI